MIPRMAGAFDEQRLKALPLTAVDRFVLSLVDGTTTARGLAEAIGAEPEEVIASLLKLESLRIVVLPSARDTTTRRASVPPPPAAPPAPAAENGEEVVDLEPDHQREIDEIHASLATHDHYAVLGLSRDADKKAVKRAYFERTSRFHPDRFFRRKLGPYKLKMESVFGRMTEAHDVLTNPERRAEYDAYMRSVAKSRTMEELLADAMAEVKRAEQAVTELPISSIPPPPSSATPISSVPPPSTTPRTPSPLPPNPAPFDPPSSPNLGAFISETLEARTKRTSTGRISVIPATPAPSVGRRELLARRLMGAAAPRVPKAGPVPAVSYAKTEDAVDALKRRYQDKVALARTTQVRKYTDAAIEAKGRGDVVAAANSYRVALELDPENAELQSAYTEAQTAADTLLVEQYLKQAEYEEKAERWADAGRSWARVARARATDSKAQERAAFCILKANGNLHDAVALGQQAVQLEPKNVAYRRTLANVYMAAGLTLNAKRELEAAVQLAPDDAATVALLKRIAKSA